MMDGVLEVAWRSRTGIASEGAVAKPGNAEELPPPGVRFQDVAVGDLFAVRSDEGVDWFIKMGCYTHELGGASRLETAWNALKLGEGRGYYFGRDTLVYRVKASLSCTIIKPE